MPEYKYDLIDDKGRVIASGMTLGDATYFLRSLMEKYYLEEEISYIIRRNVYLDTRKESDEIGSMKEDWAERSKDVMLKDNPDYLGQ